MKKKAWVMMPWVHSLESHIKKAMINLDYDVKLSPECPLSKTSLSYSLFTKSPTKIKKQISNNYFNNLLNQTDSDLDYFLLIRGEIIPEWFIKSLKTKLSKKTKFIMYQWDIADSLPNIKNLTKYFDSVVTFDYCDAKKHDWKFRPTFYLNEHKIAANALKDNLYSVAFIGTHHTDRYTTIKSFLNANPKLADKSFIHIYKPFHSVIYNKLLGRNQDRLPFSQAKKKLPSEKSVEKLAQSKIIFDPSHDHQSGATMRSLESVGLKKKLVTTNPYIKKHDFYHPNNIYVIDKKDMKIPDDFLSSPTVDLPQNIYDKYHINNWLKDILQ